MVNDNLDKLFEKITQGLDVDLTKYLVPNELSPDQDKIFTKAKETLEKNLNGEVKKYGGKINDEEFKKIEDELKKRLNDDTYKDERKNLEKIITKWIELKKSQITNFMFAIFPLKDMPFPLCSFMTIPRITWTKDKLDKMTLNTNGIAFAGEILALVTRTTLYGRPMKNSPLFAPHIGPLDLAGYKPDPNQKGAKSEDPKFVWEIIEALDRKTTQNHVTRYDDQYERHGEPICDFLMKDDDLMKTLSNLTSAMDSKRQISNAAIPAIVLTLINTSLVIATDESTSKDKYDICFEALIKLSAACYETPGVKKGAANEAQAVAMTQAAQSQTPAGMGVGAMVPQGGSVPSGAGMPGMPPPMPSQPQLPVWTEEELAEEAKKSGLPPPDLPVWTEEELAEEAKKSGGINLPVWTEEELEQENAKRHGSFNIPEWTEDESMFDCPKCGYTCRKGWDECPVCNSSLAGVEPPAKTSSPQPEKKGAETAQSPKPNEDKKEDQKEQESSEEGSKENSEEENKEENN